MMHFFQTRDLLKSFETYPSKADSADSSAQVDCYGYGNYYLNHFKTKKSVQTVIFRISVWLYNLQRATYRKMFEIHVAGKWLFRGRDWAPDKTVWCATEHHTCNEFDVRMKFSPWYSYFTAIWNISQQSWKDLNILKLPQIVNVSTSTLSKTLIFVVKFCFPQRETSERYIGCGHVTPVTYKSIPGYAYILYFSSWPCFQILRTRCILFLRIPNLTMWLIANKSLLSKIKSLRWRGHCPSRSPTTANRHWLYLFFLIDFTGYILN